MALPIIEDARMETIEEYRLCFSLADAPGCGWAFPCDATGNVDEAALHPAALDNLRQCRSGQLRVRCGSACLHGQTIVCDGVICQRSTIRLPAIVRCPCGALLELESSWLNTCSSCGRDYDGSGTVLSSRQHWGEETGEYSADLVIL